MMRRVHRAMLWTLILIVVGCVAGAAVVLTADSILAPIGNDAAVLSHRILPADIALEQTSIQARVGQVAFLDALQATNTGDKVAAISRADQAGQRQDAQWATYLKIAGHTAQEQPLQAATAGAFASSRASGALLIAASPTDPGYAANLASERGASANGLALLDKIQARFYDPSVSGNADAVLADIANGRTTIQFAAAAAFLTFLGVGAVMVRRVRRDGQTSDRDARVRAVEHRRSEVETRLQRALEMESTEDGTYDVIRQALGTVAGGRAVELLVADSSQAHFRQVLSTVDAGVGACRVAAPGECPAASSGQTRRFEDSDLLDTCPYLRKHPDRVWATCVPVSIAGRTTGVLHAEGPIDAPANDELPTELELVSRKAGDRIGVMRVLASTEAQAQADPLTGLPNRRTLENRTHSLLEHDMDFVVAFADLDHFKNLNDLHGHETGDRALRLFARVLRDTIRPRDIPARYGGEEFVVVLPDCTIPDARIVAERIRSQLALAIGAATVPTFTVSVGLAAANPDEALSEVIARADGALLKAKQIGRDRVVVAGEPIETKPAELAATVVVGPAAHN
jgi:diguanylate cyclase (GGDEF)-like protein